MLNEGWQWREKKLLFDFDFLSRDLKNNKKPACRARVRDFLEEVQYKIQI
jgi:hypothetical protein